MTAIAEIILVKMSKKRNKQTKSLGVNLNNKNHQMDQMKILVNLMVNKKNNKI